METKKKFQPAQRRRDARRNRGRRRRQENDSSSPFLALPVHLREIVLQICLKTRGGIEFCPEPFRWEPGFNANMSRHREDGLLLAEAKLHHVERVRSGIGESIGLLRASKQLHEEAAKVLYGQNGFRFTSAAGWMGLEYFLYHIDMRNVRLLREITIMHPRFMQRPTSTNNADVFFEGLTYWQQIRADNKKEAKFGHGRRWFEDWSAVEPLRVLNKIEDLRHLRLLVPSNLGPTDLELDLPLDEHRFKNLHVTIGQKFLTSNSGKEAVKDGDEDDGASDEEIGVSDASSAPSVSAEDITIAHNARHGSSWKAEALMIDILGGYTTEFLHKRVGRD